MNFVAKIFVAILFVAGTTACGNSSSEQPQREADAAAAEFLTSVKTVDALPAPAATWSDAKLNEYDALIANCIAKAKQLEELAGKPGANVNSKWSMPTVRRVLEKKLALSAAVRQEKAAAQTPAAKQAKAVDTVTQLKAQFQSELKFLEAEAPPEKSWSAERLAHYEAALNHADQTIQDLETAVLAAGQKANLFDSKQLLREKREELQIFKVKAS